MSGSYYDDNAETFFADSVTADVGDLHGRFLPLVRAGGRILDAGCGSGRDSLAFLQAGFDVTAFDASEEMVRLATRHSGLPVIQMPFDEVDWRHRFDGVWACASLLHVVRADLPEVVGRLVGALRPGGVMFASFKYGTEERDHHGRRFTDLDEVRLESLFEGAGLAIVDLVVGADGRPGREHERWVSSVGRK
jgi:2-polyprenyl-3-methyl-5-hydroxy-6-metoxy-1,4-benzoquinol methylase